MSQYHKKCFDMYHVMESQNVIQYQNAYIYNDTMLYFSSCQFIHVLKYCIFPKHIIGRLMSRDRAINSVIGLTILKKENL